jgi:hypothetical protein
MEATKGKKTHLEPVNKAQQQRLLHAGLLVRSCMVRRSCGGLAGLCGERWAWRVSMPRALGTGFALTGNRMQKTPGEGGVTNLDTRYIQGR